MPICANPQRIFPGFRPKIVTVVILVEGADSKFKGNFGREKIRKGNEKREFKAPFNGFK